MTEDITHLLTGLQGAEQPSPPPAPPPLPAPPLPAPTSAAPTSAAPPPASLQPAQLAAIDALKVMFPFQPAVQLPTPAPALAPAAVPMAPAPDLVAAIDRLESKIAKLAAPVAVALEPLQMTAGTTRQPADHALVGQLFVSFAVLTGFFVVTGLVLLNKLDANSMLVGGVLTMAGSVVAFWTGTTPASARKTEQLAQLTREAHDSVPADIARQLLASPKVQADAGALLGKLRQAL